MSTLVRSSPMTAVPQQPTAGKKAKIDSEDDCRKLSKEALKEAKKQRKKERAKMLKAARKEAREKGRVAVLMPAVPKVHPYVPQQKTNLEGASFSSLKKLLTLTTVEAVNRLPFQKMTKVQALVIPLLAAGSNVRFISPAATGKTLAFLIPALDRLNRTHFKKSAGAGVVILCPNVALCRQSEAVLAGLLHSTTTNCYTACVAAGGAFLSAEAEQVKRANILFCTPASLREHLDKTEGFSIEQVMMTVLDEFDTLLSHFDLLPHMLALRPLLPKKHQLAMVSSTKGNEDEALFAILLGGRKFADVDLRDSDGSLGVVQEYMLCPTHYRLPVLQRLLMHISATRQNRKTVVFCGMADTARLCSGLLTVMGVKNTTLLETSDWKQVPSSEVLLCLDLDTLGCRLPGVECVVHFDPPLSASLYAHRVGCLAEAPAGRGLSVALLRPEETCFLEVLQEKLGALLLRREVPLGHLPGQLATIHMAVHNTPGLEDVAQRAASLYRGSYRRLKPKTMFPFQGLHKSEVQAAFGLTGRLEKAVLQAADARMQPYLRQLTEWEN